MNRSLLTVLLIFISLCCIVNESYGWDGVPIPIIKDYDPKYVLQYEILLFDGGNSQDHDPPPEYGDRITDYDWIWPSSAYYTWESPADGGKTAKARFSPPGQYTVRLKVKDDENIWSALLDQCTVRVVEVSLSGGGYVAVNNDDDNANEKPDYHSSEQTVTGENDLVAIQLSVDPDSFGGEMKLTALGPYKNSIRVWKEQTKQTLYIGDGTDYKKWAPSALPSTLWVEGVSPTGTSAQAKLTLLYDPPSPHPYLQPVEEIYFTVLEVDLDMDGVDDSSQKTEEIVPGGFIALNQDDDDNNESADKGQSGPITGEDNLVMITLNKVSPTNLTGYVTLTASTKVKIWGSETKGGSPITLPKTYSTPSDLPKNLWLEGFDNSSSVRDAGLTLEYSIGGTTFDDIIKLTVVKVDVEVAGSDNDTEEIPSVKPASKVPDDHFVTVKGSGYIGLWATTVPDDIEVDETISWTGITQHPDENLYAYKSRASSGKFANVRVNVCGRDAKDLTNWVVWSTASLNANQIDEDVHSTYTMIWGGYDETFTITPGAIATQSDRPDLEGENPDDPPDVPAGDTGVYNKGVGLFEGANKRWDSSRQIRTKIINPDGLDFSKFAGPIKYYTTYLNYPSDDVCGNDDEETTGEDNDPYSPPHEGSLFALDNPHQSSPHSEGNLGDTWEKRMHMRAFARLNIGNKWYLISDLNEGLWKTHFKFIKQNESEATWDMDFNEDGDKLDTVPVWRDNGSFNGKDNEDF